jgi:hypothetical protein
MHQPLLQAFPFPNTLREVTLHTLSQGCMFIYSSHGKWSPLLWSFPPTATFTSFPASGCWACAATPAFSSWLVVRDSPLPQHSGHPSLFATCLFCCYWLLFIFIFFFLGVWVALSRGLCWSVQGAMLIWPRIVCGSTAYCLAHLVVCVFPSHLGTGIWQWHRSPPGFSI